ncbi:MAG: SDR family NAD(P)-dependent oxidoreductase [Alphaproteobacteria bacterium]|nr:SDR family NAD(P)-dependent oxidoreductase [Alphaproteobacteria bacterium]
MTGRLANRIALVTGASRGIGAAVAKRFAREGAHVVLVARTQGGLEQIDDEIRTAGGTATLVPLDLQDFESIDRLAAVLAERHGKLDILVGNAAILGALSPMSHYEPKTWVQVIDINLNANWRLIRDFDALLRLSDAGRAVFVTSGVARDSRAYWGPYAASKAGLENMVQGWAAELAKTTVRANLIDPGRVRTGMRRQAYPGEDANLHPMPDAITDPFVDLVEPSCLRNGELVVVGR